jgi:hypothetical protein
VEILVYQFEFDPEKSLLGNPYPRWPPEARQTAQAKKILIRLHFPSLKPQQVGMR